MALHPSLVAHRGIFVTGTDTGVGKTLIACALLAAFADSGMKAAGMKPVACGAEPGANGLVNEDVERLVAAGNVAAPREHVNPFCFTPPIAPHIAAQRAGVTIAWDSIERSFRALAALADVVVVEGVGGFHVPLGPDSDAAELAARLALPVVLVVGMRLGCLNHALLTAEAVANRGLRLAGWIANHVDPQMIAADENVAALEARIGAPRIARISYMREPDYRAIAASFNVANPD